MKNANIRMAFGVLLTVLLWTQPSLGQLPGASPATLGTANNYTVLARGFAAIGLNPAGLGMPETEGFTLALFPVQINQSLGPLTFSDLFDYEGVLVPRSVREDWIEQIAANGGQAGSGTLAVTEFSFSWSNFGVQLSTIASGQTDLNEAAAELLFFGNTGRIGEPGDFDLEGSGLTGYAVTTLAISAGFPIARRWVPGLEQGFSIGATLKQSWGHTLVFAEDAGTLLQGDPLSVDMEFPIIHPTGDFRDFGRGSGIGFDLGVSWERGPWAAAAVVQNLINSFDWDLSELSYRSGVADFQESTTNLVDFEEQPGLLAPQALQDKIADLDFKPSVILGGAYDASEKLTVTAELRQRIGDGLDTGPKSHIGLGMEFLPTPSVPLRAGFAAITNGFQLGGGLGLILGVVHIGFAALYQTGDVGDGMAGTLGISFGGG